MWGIHSLKKLYGIGEYEKQSTGVDIADNSNLLELADNICQNPNSGGGIQDTKDLQGKTSSRKRKYQIEFDKLTKTGTFDPNYFPQRTKMLLGIYGKYNQPIKEDTPSKDRSPFNCERYKFFLEDGAPPISNQCCNIMKKGPAHSYQKKTGRNPMIATMASESRMRTQAWLKTGCNAFDSKRPQSTPMAFWTEQDVLLYIKENNIPLCSAYGEIVEDYNAEGQVEGQMDLADLGLFEKERPVLKTTGCERTGCMFCGFGCHLEKYPSRFEKMKITHPKQYEYIMKPWDEGGLGYKEVIDWINEHGNLHIRY